MPKQRGIKKRLGRSNHSFRTLRWEDGKRKDLKKQKFGKVRKERAKGDEGGEAKGSPCSGSWALE